MLQSAANHRKIHVNLTIFCHYVLLREENRMPVSKSYHRVLVFEKNAKNEVLLFSVPVESIFCREMSLTLYAHICDVTSRYIFPHFQIVSGIL